MSDNFTGLLINAVSTNLNADGSTPITLEDGTIHNLKAGLVASIGQYLVVDSTTGTEQIVTMQAASDIEVTEPVATTIPLTTALATIAAPVAPIVYTGVTFASGIVVGIADLTAPVTLNVAPATTSSGSGASA